MNDDISQLVRQAKAGDTQAFGRVYDLFAQRIFRYINQKVCDVPQAQDILQDTFLKAWKALPELREDGLNFSAWLYRIAGNCVNDHFRKKYRSPQTAELDEALTVAGNDDITRELAAKDSKATIESALACLPPAYRQILELRFVQEFSVSETAKILRKSSVAVRVTQYRALKKLKTILEQNHDLEPKKIQ